MKNTIKNNHGCTTPWTDFHPVLWSRSVWQPRSYPGPADSKTQAGITENLRKSRSLTSSSKTLIFPVCCFLSVCGSEMQPSCNPPGNTLLLSNPIPAEKALLQTWKRKMRRCDTQNLLFWLAKEQNPHEQVLVSNSKDPGGNVSWGAAALHLLLLKHLGCSETLSGDYPKLFN